MTWLSNSLSGTQQWSGVIYAAIMILLLLFLPMGITGLFTKRRLVSVKTAFRRQSRAETLECATVAEADGSTEACETQVALPVLRARAREPRARRRRAGRPLRRPAAAGVGDRGRRTAQDPGRLRRLRRAAGGERGLPGRARGTDRRPHRAERRRQDDPVQRGQQAAARLRRAGLARRRGDHRSVAGGERPPRHGAHLPEPAHLREHGRTRERPRRVSPAREGRVSSQAASACRSSAARRRRRGRAPWTRCDSSASTPSPISPRRVSPTGSSAWSRSPGRWRPSRACSCWTSRPPA